MDPYNGRRDLDRRLLRHVSPAFCEDPVRILRVARLSARFAHLGFRVADETNALMRRMVAMGEVDALVAERVWAELVRALAERTPTAFIEVLRGCGALARLFPEIDRLFGVPQPPEHHPEIDTGVHTLMVLEQAARLSENPLIRFAALTHDLGKGLTPKDQWPSHHGHETTGLTALDALCQRFRVPTEYRRLAAKVMRFHGRCHRAFELRPATLLDTLQSLDALRRKNMLDLFLAACQADATGRKGRQQQPYPQAELFRAAQQAALAVRVEPLIEQGMRGAEIGEALRHKRIHAIKQCRKSFPDMG